MAFDLNTARPVGKFDINTARPVAENTPSASSATPDSGTAYEGMNADSAQRAKSQGLLRNFAHGASFGFDDELAGLVSELTGGDYQSAKDAYARERDAYQRENPAKSFAANVAGGVGAGGAAGKLLQIAGRGAQAVAVSGAAPAVVERGAQILTEGAQPIVDAFKELPRWAQLAGLGGAAGAAQGAGDANEGERVAGALKGGAIGMAVGGVLPPALGVAAKVLDSTVGNVGRMAINAMRTPEEQGLRLLAKDLNRDGVTPTELKNTLQSLGPNAMIGDAGGKNTLRLVDYATQVPGEATDKGMAALEARARGAGGRVVSALTDKMGVKSTNFDELTQGLHENMRALSPEYEAALSSTRVPTTENLAILTQDPIVKRAIGAAREIIRTDSTISQLRGNGPLSAFEKELSSIEVTPPTVRPASGLAQAAGPQSKSYAAIRQQTVNPYTAKTEIPDTATLTAQYENVPTLRAWDYVKRGIDSIVQENTDPLTGKMTPLGGRAEQLRKALVSELDSAAPEYRAVRAKYADQKAGEHALELGRSFMREDSEVTARRLEDMTPAERKYFMAGAARAVSDKIRSAPDTGMAYADFLKRPLLREKLQAAFGGNTEAFNAFMKQLENEARMGATFSTARGNSASAARLAKSNDVGEPIASLDIPTSPEGILKRLALTALKPSEEVSSQLGTLLLTNDPTKNAQTITRLETLLPRLNQKVIPESTRQSLAALLGQQGGRLPSALGF